jgi:ABC-type branched-subunit amino acid transport system substrate-binding protein
VAPTTTTGGPASPGATPGLVSSGDSSSPGVAAVRGTTATTANLGITYLSGGDALFSSFGFSIATGDARGFSEALLAIINSRGGVLGRKIVPVFHEVKASDAADPKTAEQGTCAAFTQDNKVFAAVNAPTDCMVAAKVPIAPAGGQGAFDSTYFAERAPYFYGPPFLNTDSLTPTLLDRLQARKFLTPQSRIGLFYSDTVVQQRIMAKLKKALAARGLNVVATFGRDPNNEVASSGNGVLPFRTANVDKIISFDASIGIFMIAAERQGYRPKYALTTYLNLASVMEVVPPREQLAGSFGVGWQPRNDVNEQQQISLPGSRDCALAAKNSGQPNPTGSAAFILWTYCDAIQTFVYGAQHGGGFSPADIRRGLTAAGASFPTALNFSSAYGLGRYDGAKGVREIAYVTGCSCFRYQGTTSYPTS